jgi:pimeloyl-ACP methyl ester carboxylesterase
MEKVTPIDGTTIAYYRKGAGVPLVLVSGTGAANPLAWTEVVSAFSERFLVCAVDRRGHGESGDSPSYAIECEFEDIAAVVDALGEPAHILGHSFGGLIALEAALRTENVSKLVLYEPAIVTHTGVSPYPPGFLDRLESLLDKDDREGALLTHYRELAKMSPDEIELLRSSPAWPERLAIAHTLVRELRTEESYSFDDHRFRKLKVPTLLLLGGESADIFKNSIEVLETTLPNSRIVILQGQQHVAMYTAPQLFARQVMEFLSEPG